MDKIEYRSVIKFLNLKGETSKEIKAQLDFVYGDSAPSFTTVKVWVAQFKRGRTSVFDDERSGRPKTATNDAMIDKVHQVVLDDQRLKVREIASAVGISAERVLKILSEDLGMRKLTGRWVPRLLTLDEKRIRHNISKECLDRFQRDTTDFLRRFVTVDKIWIHRYTPESKKQPKRWTLAEKPVPKKAKTSHSAGKVMTTVFWDSHGVLLVDYLQKEKTITGEYYASLLERLDEEIAKKRPYLEKERVLLHQDDVQVPTSAIAMAKLHELGYELLPHPPYSPDLAPCSFFLFSNMKNWLTGKTFTTVDEMTAAVNDYFAGFDQTYFTDGIKGLEKRWTTCIKLKGDYIEV
ncbi:PREDICTED: histone-lysine N-methyltransferase SETMAR-like [Dinoponera quadriceps]|uniref:Histone-lysine N-methyltransferase SETMAR-like n=1 Tax=Dinoponera quadriceps TaxID=609295 RepID=A0A6P3Y5T2_DINQU|nr:PREDICTED: histone-lysine N-methyltransferase SETMAR-like [Dinoponera quadriceps]